MAIPTFPKFNFSPNKSESRRSSRDTREKCGSTLRVLYSSKTSVFSFSHYIFFFSKMFPSSFFSSPFSLSSCSLPKFFFFFLPYLLKNYPSSFQDFSISFLISKSLSISLSPHLFPKKKKKKSIFPIPSLPS